MSTLVRLFALSVIPVLIALSSGCGGDPGAETVTVATQSVASTKPAGVTRNDFIQQADERCDESLDELAPLGERLERIAENEDIGLFRQLRRYAETLHDIGIVYEDLALDLRDMRRPRGDGAVIGRFVRLLDQIPLQLDVSAAGIRSLDLAQLNKARRRIYRSLLRVQGIADGFGFKVCGRKRPSRLDRGLRSDLTPA